VSRRFVPAATGISYEDHLGSSDVYLDGKRIGRIQERATRNIDGSLKPDGGGWVYITKSGARGEVMPTRAAVKRSLDTPEQDLAHDLGGHEARHHDGRAARGVRRRGGRHAAPPHVLAHALGRDVVPAHREAGADEVLREGRAQEAHPDAGHGRAHAWQPSEPGRG